jgi:hypothetical protein
MTWNDFLNRAAAAMPNVEWTDVLPVVLAVLSNMGVNITAFIASLGIGGIALALAVQNILADLFASLAIAVDKPFEVGTPSPWATSAAPSSVWT